MAITSANIADAAHNANNPRLLFGLPMTAGKWLDLGAAYSGTDRTASGYPVSAAFDGHNGRGTKASANGKFLAFPLAASLGYNTLVCEAFIQYDTATDYDDWKDSLRLAPDATLAPPSLVNMGDGVDWKKGFIWLGGSSGTRTAYTGATHFLVGVDSGELPTIREVVVGEAIILPHRHTYPDAREVELLRNRVETQTGIVTDYNRGKPRNIFRHKYEFEASPKGTVGTPEKLDYLLRMASGEANPPLRVVFAEYGFNDAAWTAGYNGFIGLVTIESWSLAEDAGKVTLDIVMKEQGPNMFGYPLRG